MKAQLEQVLEKYPQNVKLVFKNFPLRRHAYAQPAAVAAMAAQRQGKFWEFHDLLFENYGDLKPQKIMEILKMAGVEEKQFARDMKDSRLLAAISRDISEGVQAGVRGTPTVFINGKLLRDRTPTAIDNAIQKELQSEPH